MPIWISEELKKLISSIIKVDPSERISLESIKSNKWFNMLAYKKTPFIDTRKFKVPTESAILNHFKKFGFDPVVVGKDV